MKKQSVNILSGGGGSPEQSQRVVFGRQLDENYSRPSARQARPRSWLQARALAFNAKGGEPAESVAERLPQLNPSKILAFTMAEILLSLTIIGVVAAITLPSLTGNINERTWNTQRKALYARFSQAIALMPALNGYGTLQEVTDSTIGSTSIEDTAAETFITAGLSKVLKINNICDNEHLEDCGIPANITNLAGSKTTFPLTLNELNAKNTSALVNFTDSYSKGISLIDSKAAAFETGNGESIAVFYNPYCVALTERIEVFVQNKFCANFIYDLNGNKGPNTLGKDMGVMTAFYPSDGVVAAPIPDTQDAVASVASKDIGGVCKQRDENYRLPSKEELASLFINKNLIGNMEKSHYWTSSVSSSLENGSSVGKYNYTQNHWYINYTEGMLHNDSAIENLSVRCVKR